MASNAPLPVQYQMKAETQNTMNLSMATYQQEGRFTDLLLVSNGQSIKCHKVVVCSASPYLARLVVNEAKGNATEAIQQLVSVVGKEASSTIELNDIPYEILLQLVHYMYGMKQSTEWDILKAIIAACTKLQLADLKEELGSYAEKNVSANDCIGWWKFAEAQGLENVATRARFVMLINLEEVKGSPEFKELPFEELVAYVTHDDVVLPNRDTMLVACIEWVDYEPAARRCHVLELFKRVELQLCSIEVLDIITTKYSDLVSDPDVTREIHKAIIPMMKKHSNRETQSLLCCEYDNQHLKFYKSDIMLHDWTLLTTLTAQLSSASIVILPMGFAVISLNHSYKNALYNASTKSWIDFPHTPRRMTNTANAITMYCDNYLYIFGAYGSEVNIKMNLDTLEWSETPPIPTQINDYRQGVSTGNHIYAVTSNALYHFNCKTQKWRSLTGSTIDANTYGYVLVTDNKHLYLVGGRHSFVSVYTISEDRWARLEARGRNTSNIIQSGSMFSHEKIVVFSKGSFSYDVYDTTKKTWSSIEWKGKLHICNSYHRISSYNGQPVVMTMVDF